MAIYRRDHVLFPKNPLEPVPPLTVESVGTPTIENKFASPEPFVDGMKMKLSAVKVKGMLRSEEEVELAGPTQNIFFDPLKTKVAIVTCGGLCPGLNNVIRGIVLNMYNRYNVTNVFGLKWGYEGLNPETSEVLRLTPDLVGDIHQNGGSILGTSRGAQDPKLMAQFLIDNGFDILFTIGGDGTLKGANAINKELRLLKVPIVVVGIPKTIDNDISYTDTTFGFQTAVGLSQEAIKTIHNEAKSAKNGIGLVRLMGRDAGFIALNASLANGDVNMVLIPEKDVPIKTICAFVEKRLTSHGHIVIVVAEGAMQNEKPKDLDMGVDKSGNIIHWDAITYLRQEIGKYLSAKNIEYNLKFVDPSYMIRASKCTSGDAQFCMCLSNAAVHVAMAGKTGLVICHHNGNFVSMPIDRTCYYTKRVNPDGPLLAMMDSIEGKK
ncbi:6-phosphofructokinase, putative [Entamoeba invadens IP1]|uniref:6-phosphofructokinase, putative n=1 Tax=Entamoeba invadens TaxID=33085 RepID=S0B2B7_ENTIV|nr:6-phosphofructokinase, putative [Entamoeba invadens IP1]ELP85118.1 6-phosphofructokinase, putative [Entamoeba invadens IP1]BAN40342.1 6-phosphofructokinase, putative [Entamoeba invadens]BAN40640.1 6-phosphofructokinase, putative [Entamoeba invadens]BAN41920.1 6-phosphofructokinase, putative [Entamoeba invadens]|eukprot:XP_004184464.1 6-phosphofructokinase, putative [Entamoeba invadens IP1]